ncbi:hypothetical protein [Chryseobacterium sp.]|uniref:hypothetical protein n=1 Tax=Chryseobacterium sp. TaxID=1871047 RepID=UPI0011C94EE4|nr:hypothetical protein [Chryseobacterium sp.]TXF78912.1 hypothetical protein FUA25_00510 [Chryseobacterium sp.]
MKSTFKYFLLFFLVLSYSTIKAQNYKEVLKSSHIKNFYDGTNFNTIKIKDGIHYETIENRYLVVSKVIWIDDQSFFLEIIENDVPDFPFSSGARMKINILKKENDFIFYEAELRGKKFKGKYQIIK